MPARLEFSQYIAIPGLSLVKAVGNFINS